MPYFRIMMKARPGFSPECWAECDAAADLAPLIQEMREHTGDPEEPARVLVDDGYGNESLYLVDDPAGRFGPGEASAPAYEFDQQDHGAVMPTVVATDPGTCTQCGRKGRVATVRLVGMGQDLTVKPCVECLFDIAAGTDVMPLIEATAKTDAGMSRLSWDPVRKTPRFLPVASGGRRP